MVSTVKAICGYAKSWVPAPVQKAGAAVSEVFWNNVSRAKALCTRDTLIGTAGSLLTAYGIQELRKNLQQQEVSILSTGGALLAGAVGIGMTAQGVYHGRKEICNANRIISEKQKIEKLNQDMARVPKNPGANEKETILIAIDANDHNGALTVNEHLVRNIKRWAGDYSIHVVLIENPSDWDQACNQLTEDGKTINHILVLAHGETDKVELGGQKVQKYLDKRPALRNVDRCLFWSCSAGIEDGAAQDIADKHPEWEIQAPRSTATRDKSFLGLDASRKPTIIQFSERRGEIITDIFKNNVRYEYPLENERTIINALEKDDAEANECWQKLQETLTIATEPKPSEPETPRNVRPETARRILSSMMD